jgi:hypothetical protein
VAKQNQAAVLEQPPKSDATKLAMQLFVAAWRPDEFKLEQLAAKCLDAAEAFERVRQERSY